MDHYATLGVTPKATPEEIKKAYYRKAREHHPDKGGDAAMFKKVAAAYDSIQNQPQVFFRQMVLVSITLEEAFVGANKVVAGHKVYIKPHTLEGSIVHVHGSVYALVQFLKHDMFSVRMRDLHCYIDISFKDSLMSPNIKLTLPTQKEIEVTVDGTIKPSSKVNLRNKGLDGGSLVIHFNVIYPEKLNDEQKNVIEKFF